MGKDHWDAILASAPLNATAGAVTSRSKGLTPVGPKVTCPEWDGPPAFAAFIANPQRENLVGRKVGRLTVVGYLGNGKWCCRCTCGKFVQRKGKSVLNPTNAEVDRCTGCRHTAYLQREAGAERTAYRRANGIVQL